MSITHIEMVITSSSEEHKQELGSIIREAK